MWGLLGTAVRAKLTASGGLPSQVSAHLQHRVAPTAEAPSSCPQAGSNPPMQPPNFRNVPFTFAWNPSARPSVPQPSSCAPSRTGLPPEVAGSVQASDDESMPSNDADCASEADEDFDAANAEEEA
mmetsp:Transcript_55254/g.120448  ORF Transcript_55254/g.120448 Transcript_55254/m.120448 type:complete len:126 (-) Transcript_55254:685-1062(-)